VILVIVVVVVVFKAARFVSDDICLDRGGRVRDDGSCEYGPNGRE